MHAERMTAIGLRRYGPGAHFYDVLSLERPIYRVGRIRGIDMLGLRTGDRVLDVGCGTGLNFPLLHNAIGDSGAIVGVDASTAMLAMARRRIARSGWSNVEVLEGDAAQLDRVVGTSEVFDAIVFTYALSVIVQWERAWDLGVAQLRRGGRVLVVDMALPTGWGRPLRPLARFACFTGGADPHREPWRRLMAEGTQVIHRTLRSGHIHVVAGTVADHREVTT